MAFIDTKKVSIPKGFFNDLNTPKLLDWLESQPVADAEEIKHGHWIKSSLGLWSCSECQTEGSPYWRRCPLCEAKMDGGLEIRDEGKNILHK